MNVFLLFSCLCVVCEATSRKSYNGYALIHATPGTKSQLEALIRLEENEVDFLLEASKIGQTAQVLVDPTQISNVLDYLKMHSISTNVSTYNYQHLIDLETESNGKGRRKPLNEKSYRQELTPPFSIHQYHSSAEIHEFMAVLAVENEFVELQKVGRSFEGRNIYLLKIGNSSTKVQNCRPSFWIDCGIHAREWLSTSTCVWIINNLVTMFNAGDADIVSFVNTIDFYILPIVNVDGYEHSRTSARMWRKNKSGPHTDPSGNICYGVDLNRNYDSHWGGTGASSSPCSNTYRGPKAFSEPESQFVSKYLLNLDNLKAFFTLHTFGQEWMHPYGYARRTFPANYNEYRNLSQNAVAAIHDIKGEVYLVGSVADLKRPTSGNSLDWATTELNVTWAFGLELGRYGFVLPATHIVPLAQDIWPGIRVVIQRVFEDARRCGHFRPHIRATSPSTNTNGGSNDTSVSPGILISVSLFLSLLLFRCK